MQKSGKTVFLNILCVFLVLLAGCLRLVGKYTGLILHNGIILVIFALASFVWMSQIRKRILQPDVRNNLVAVALLIIFWMSVRTLKYEFIFDISPFKRWFWYLYYVPMLIIPLLMFLSVLHIGLPQNKSIDRRWNLLYIPTAVIILGVLTNDFHQLAFRFSGGPANWDDTDYIRGPFYYAAMLWMALLLAAILVVVFVRCAVPERRKKILVPAIPLFIGAIYMLCVIVDDKMVTGFLTVPEMGCFLFATFMESLMDVHLFPANDNYSALFNASSIGAGIMDESGAVRYKSEMSIPTNLARVIKAQSEPLIIEDGNAIFKSRAINGGFCYWMRDISQINMLNCELEDLGDVLAEENTMLEAENNMRVKRLRIEEQNKLYDDLARNVRSQLEKLQELLENLPENEEEFENKMKYACVLNAYVKRHSNLLLSFHESKRIYSDELRYSLVESLEYLRLYGIKAHSFYIGEGGFSGEKILLAYEVFEAAVEAALPRTDAILVNTVASEGSLTLRMELNAPQSLLAKDCLYEKISAQGGALEVETEGKTEYVTLIFPAGGEEE